MNKKELSRTIYVEKMGSGINRIKEAVKLAELPKPRFSYSEYSFSVEVKDKVQNAVGKTRGKTREKTREKIINLIKENKFITTEELAERIEVTIKGVEWNIQQMKKDKILKRIGPDKGGHWEVIMSDGYGI